MGDGMFNRPVIHKPWRGVGFRVIDISITTEKPRVELDLAAKIANAAIVKMMKQTN